MYKYFKNILLLQIILSCFVINISYASTEDFNIQATCENNTPTRSETVSIEFSFKSSKNINISAYRIKVNFDNKKLSYKGLYSNFNEDDFKSYENNGNLNIIYVTSDEGFYVNGTISVIELNFKVLSGADYGSTTISSFFDGIGNYTGERLPDQVVPDVNLDITEPEQGSCNLAYLENSEYKISPNFSKNVTNYEMSVPYNVSSIEFNYAPEDTNATTKVNRKTLKKAGTSTDILITVTSSDKKSRKIYTITVNRLNEESTLAVLSTSANNKTKNTSNESDQFVDSDNDDTSDVSVEGTSSDSATTKKNSDKTNNNEEVTIENNDNIKLQNTYEPLVVKENCFNPIFFGIILVIFIAIAILFMKVKK